MTPPPLIFLDTEFTDFTDPELIAIGLVSDDGREFYAECSDFDWAKCSAFVRENVLPRLIGTPAVVKDNAALRAGIATWLHQFSEAVVVFDYEGDWTLLCNALGECPAWLRPCNAGDLLATRLPERTLLVAAGNTHNALEDAHALRADWMAADIHL